MGWGSRIIRAGRRAYLMRGTVEIQFKYQTPSEPPALKVQVDEVIPGSPFLLIKIKGKGKDDLPTLKGFPADEIRWWSYTPN